MRRGTALGWVLAAIIVAGISVLLVRATSGPREAAAEPARFSGARSVASLASVMRPARLPSAVRVAIIREPGSAGYYETPASFDSIVDRWRGDMESVGAHVMVVPAHRLTDARGADVIVLPASPCVGPATREAVDAHLRAGRGVVLTWLTGIRDGGCSPAGWQMLAAVTGASRLDTLPPAPESYLTVPVGGPLSFDIPPGGRLEVVVANHVTVRHRDRDAYWSDFALNPLDVNGQPLLDGAIVHAKRFAGRVVYWGFDLTRVVNTPWNRNLAQLLLRNTLAWAAGVPVATVEPWPGGHTAAAVIAQDVETEFENGQHALDSLHAAGVRGTYFVVGELARRHPELVKAMAENGEVASHSEDHGLLGGLPDSVQRRRLAVVQRTLRELVGAPVQGLRPPEEQFDRGTLDAWATAGGAYLFAATNMRSASPEIIDLGRDSLVLLGRTSNDDFISVRRLGREHPDELAEEYLAAFQKIRAIGGLYLLSYHSHMLARPALVPAVATVARAIAQDRTTWLTTAGEVARWWASRSAVSAQARRARDGTLEIRVANGGSAAVRDAVIAVSLPPGMAPPTNTSEGTLLEARDGVARIAIDALAAGQTRVIRLTAASGARNAD